MISHSNYARLAELLNISSSTPVHRVEDHCFVIRDDQTHPIISGNKWRKLVGYLSDWERKEYAGIVTFGGAYSNHLHACAWVCHRLNIPLITVIKGLSSYRDNPTIRDLQSWNARIEFLSPRRYERLKNSREYWNEQFPDWLIIPEGGQGPAGQGGFAFLHDELDESLPKNAPLIIAAGTGTSAAGMDHFLSERYMLDIWPVVNREDVEQQFNHQTNSSHYTIRDKRTGAFASWDKRRFQWILDWWQETGILLDPVYTGPVLYEALEEYNNRAFILYHSGGLQGWRGFLDRHEDKINSRDRQLILDGIHSGSG